MASKEERATAIDSFSQQLAAFAQETEGALAQLKAEIQGMRDSGQIDVEDYSAYEPDFEQAAGTMQAALNEFSQSQAGRLQGLAQQIRGVGY